ncbi:MULTISPECIES: hypothetical protein [Burkholderia]|uniref:hypothetical protein n=1 Tax=Burkholderia TaxID=32008 RepID=UPI0015C6617E|nr:MULTISPECIES: hypothetical protein [Burkholderia]
MTSDRAYVSIAPIAAVLAPADHAIDRRGRGGGDRDDQLIRIPDRFCEADRVRMVEGSPSRCDGADVAAGAHRHLPKGIDALKRSRPSGHAVSGRDTDFLVWIESLFISSPIFKAGPLSDNGLNAHISA